MLVQISTEYRRSGSRYKYVNWYKNTSPNKMTSTLRTFQVPKIQIDCFCTRIVPGMSCWYKLVPSTGGPVVGTNAMFNTKKNVK